MQRIDKWLWFARFYKSRTLAAEMIAEGRVRLNGERCVKTSQIVRAGDVLTFAAGANVRVVRVISGGVRRGPATEARTLYEDLSPLPERRPDVADAARDKGSGRPTKKERRALERLRHSPDDE
ncbi:MAG: RNA-binding S4 domain-containing protein [Alphaproteobacteria bacterium]|nr:RNA-binding S4 domain-containing protein [Alphaproteobacteria bacterium]